jgi:hypothetical protein
MPSARTVGAWATCVWLIDAVSFAAELPSHYFPLTVGNTWVYESSEGSADAPVTETWEIIEQQDQGFIVRIQLSLLDTHAPKEILTVTPDGVTQSPQSQPYKPIPASPPPGTSSLR